MRAAPASLVVLTAVATWLLSDVTAGEAARFVAYEAGYTLLPGCLLYVLLSPEPGGCLRTLAIGWPCGYAIEVGWFALTAALHIRAAFALLPLIAILIVGPLLYRRYLRRQERRRRSERSDHARGAIPRGSGWDALLVALAISGALIVLAFTFFSPAPLPAGARSVVYGADNVFDISLAAEARHHWPITEPWVAGQPLHYYTGSFIHMAAINQVTGVPLATVVLRFFPSIMFLVAALQLWSIGGAIGRSPWVGPLAVVLLLGAEDINLDPVHVEVFHVNPFNQFPLSPSFAFGVPFLLGLLALVQSRLLGEGSSTALERPWLGAMPVGAKGALAMVALLIVGCGAAKAFAAADFMGGLVLFWIWSVVTGRPTRLLSYGIVLAIGGCLIVYLLMLAGGTAGTLGLHPLDFLSNGNTLVRARTALQSVLGHSPLWVLVLVAGTPVIAVLLFAPVLGAIWLLCRRDLVSPFLVLCICLFAVGLFAYVMLGAPGGVEGVFLVYGYIALTPVAAMGLVALWEDTPNGLRAGAALSCGAVLALALALAAVASAAPLAGRARDVMYVLAYGLTAAAVVTVVVRRARLYALAIPSVRGRLLVCCIPPLVVLGMVKPTTLAAVGAVKTILHRPIAQADSPNAYGMTAALYQGLLWVRGHTSVCDVLAVSNHSYARPPAASLYFYYSAFAERRVFLESWYYTPNSVRVAQPFPARFALSNEATARGSASALRRLGEDGVDYVLIDRTHGGGAREPAGASRLVFDNGALDVYRISSARRRGSCS